MENSLLKSFPSDLLRENSKKKEFKNKKKKEKLKQKIALFILGIINNTTYVVVLSASKKLCEKFNKKDFIPFFSGSLVLFSILLKIINSKYLVKIRHKIRILVASILIITGILFIMLSIFVNIFFISIIGTIFVGLGTSFGSITILGFIKGFDPDIVVGFSSGTGFAGVFGSIYYEIMDLFHFNEYESFSFLIFGFIIYFLIFIWFIRLKKHFDFLLRETDLENNDDSLNDNIENKEAEINQKLNYQNFCPIIKKNIYYSLNLGFVYFFEYFCITTLATIAADNYKKDNYVHKNCFQILQIMYQIGVAISRSSLDIIKVPYLTIITFCQFFFFLLWLYFSFIITINIYFLFFAMFIVGLLGGLSFVNTHYFFYSDKNIMKSEKEISIVFISSFTDICIVSNSIIGFFIIENFDYNY